MFWKVTAVVWTVALIGGVFLLGILTFGSRATNETMEAGLADLPTRPQVTVVLGGLTEGERMIAKQALDFEAVLDQTLRQPGIRSLVANREGLKKKVTVRPVGPSGSGYFALDASGFKDANGAYDVAFATGQTLKDWLAELRKADLRGQIIAVQCTLEDVRDRANRIRQEKSRMIAVTPMAGMPPGESTLAIKLEVFTRAVAQAEIDLMDAARAQKEAERALKALTDTGTIGDAGKGLAEDNDRLAELTRVIAETLIEQNDAANTEKAPAEAGTGLDAGGGAPAGRGRQVPQTRLASGREEVATRLGRLVTAKERLADLSERLNGVKAEARDLETTRCRIASLDDELSVVNAQIAPMDDSLTELQRKLNEPGPTIVDFVNWER